MADDQSQRPYRASEPPPARGSGKTGSDPLAELARLIGQTDPFGEYGREAARRSPPSQSVARADWNQPLGTSYTAQYGGDARAPEPAPRYAGDGYPASPSAPASPFIPQDYGSQNYERQPYEAQPLAGGTDPYEAEQGSHRFPLGQSDNQQDFYDEAPVEDEYCEDAPPSRRRMVVMAIAGVAALAVIGTAGAFGYRALVGSSGSTKPPPVIKADTAPSKIVPATTGKDAQSNKLITDRVNERGQSEKLVSREEQPMDRPTAVALSQSGPQVGPRQRRDRQRAEKGSHHRNSSGPACGRRGAINDVSRGSACACARSGTARRRRSATSCAGYDRRRGRERTGRANAVRSTATSGGGCIGQLALVAQSECGTLTGGTGAGPRSSGQDGLGSATGARSGIDGRGGQLRPGFLAAQRG